MFYARRLISNSWRHKLGSCHQSALYTKHSSSQHAQKYQSRENRSKWIRHEWLFAEYLIFECRDEYLLYVFLIWFDWFKRLHWYDSKITLKWTHRFLKVCRVNRSYWNNLGWSFIAQVQIENGALTCDLSLRDWRFLFQRCWLQYDKFKGGTSTWGHLGWRLS